MSLPSLFDDLDIFMRSFDQQGERKNPAFESNLVQAFRQSREHCRSIRFLERFK